MRDHDPEIGERPRDVLEEERVGDLQRRAARERRALMDQDREAQSGRLPVDREGATVERMEVLVDRAELQPPQPEPYARSISSTAPGCIGSTDMKPTIRPG